MPHYTTLKIAGQQQKQQSKQQPTVAESTIDKQNAIAGEAKPMMEWGILPTMEHEHGQQSHWSTPKNKVDGGKG